MCRVPRRTEWRRMRIFLPHFEPVSGFMGSILYRPGTGTRCASDTELDEDARRAIILYVTAICRRRFNSSMEAHVTAR